MAIQCQITGKRPMAGHLISHSNRKTKRTFNPNLKWHKFWLSSKKSFIKLRVSAHGLKIIDKIGIEAALLRAKEKGLI